MKSEMRSESDGESEVEGKIITCQRQDCEVKRVNYEDFFGKGKYFCCRICAVEYSIMASTEQFLKNSADQEKADLEDKSTLKFNGKSLVVAKSFQGKKKDKKESVFLWTRYLAQTKSRAAPVCAFPHAILSDDWDLIQPGMKVETYNLDSHSPTKLFWFAEVMRIEGYKALLRYLGMEKNLMDFWASLCSNDVHPVGWAARQELTISPPKCIEKTQRDWKRYIIDNLQGKPTYPRDFESTAEDELKIDGLNTGQYLEIVDPTCIRKTRVAFIEKLSGGGRVSIKFFDGRDDEIFACHIKSPVCHPLGWSLEIGHDRREMPDDFYQDLKNNCVPAELFNQDAEQTTFVPQFEEGMKVEAVNATRVNSICTATIKKILNKGYLMISIDASANPEFSHIHSADSDFCYHWTSSCLQYTGFARDFSLPLTNAAGEEIEWDEEDFLPEKISDQLKERTAEKNNPFKVGWKLEAVDLMDPKLICPSTVKNVCAGLLQIGFDGWGDDFDQFIPWRSPDIYPAGWCELVNHSLQAPKETENLSKAAKRRRTGRS
ncbi:unnamed protein product [Oikopleura dioica]|uniref:Lethal(3)malignant brain tumor-like protein 2 n=1 Tax=Oikopleura dioica TaxID=34765 RepID=E4Y7C5_OIKDI|nr:unnamed protein product [Oikopleura dioica]